MSRNTHPKLESSPQPWELNELLQIVSRDPFEGELSALKRTSRGILVCDVKASMPTQAERPEAWTPRAEGDRTPPAVREMLSNAQLIMAVHPVLSTLIDITHAVRQASCYGQVRTALIAKADAVIAMATRPLDAAAIAGLSVGEFHHD
jgi:hypothetical protein